MNKTKLELTWIGKENRPRLEPRILLEDPEKSYHAPYRVTAICSDAGIAPPVFEEITGAAVVTFQVNVAGAAQRTPQVTGQVTGQVEAKSQLESELESGPSRQEVGTKSGLSRDQVKILRLCRKEGTSLELMNSVGRKNRTKFREQFIKPLLNLRLLQMTIPDKPRSRLQRYRTTAARESTLSETVKK